MANGLYKVNDRVWLARMNTRGRGNSTTIRMIVGDSPDRGKVLNLGDVKALTDAFNALRKAKITTPKAMIKRIGDGVFKPNRESTLDYDPNDTIL